jgi:MarR family transcriptional regulator, organic hydroperoxide resistance regulator
MAATVKASPRRTAAHEVWELMRSFVFSQRPRFIAVCREFDLTPPQILTLQHLDTEIAKPMSELAKLLACDASNITGITDRLEERGLVERRNSPGDRRVRMLVLTEAGATLRDEADRIYGEPPQELAELPLADQRTLRDMLRRALDAGQAGR